MTTMKPCPMCHSTERPHIEIVDDYLNGILSAKAICPECNFLTQRDYVTTKLWAEERRVSPVRMTSDIIKQWNESCDDWKGMFNHE